MGNIETAEAATGCVLLEKLFLEFLQNSQENNRTRLYFLTKLQALAAFSSEFWKNFKNTFLTENL